MGLAVNKQVARISHRSSRIQLECEEQPNDVAVLVGKESHGRAALVEMRNIVVWFVPRRLSIPPQEDRDKSQFGRTWAT